MEESISKKSKEMIKETLNEIYTPLSEAKKEIERRQKDKSLRKKVENFLGKDIPALLSGNPKAVFSRYIISPNFEFFYFWDIARLIDLEPVCLEYSVDKLVAKNSSKYHLCRLFFYKGRGKNGGSKVDISKIVNFNKEEGKKLCDIKTINGEFLVDFHHRIFRSSMPGNVPEIADFSNWFKRNRDCSCMENYYLHYLALFLCHGVLFENFLTNKEEFDFTFKRVLPSFKKLQKIFGVKPLIVPLEPFNDEADKCWYHYPESIKKFVKK